MKTITQVSKVLQFLFGSQAEDLRGELTISRALIFIAISIASFLIESQVWKRGLKQYSGASS